MNITLVFYIIDLLSNIDCVLIISIICSIIFIVIYIMCIICENYDDDEEKKLINKYIKNFIIFIFILIPLTILIPNKNTMYLMVATNYLSNENIPEKVSEIINYKLDGILKDIKKDKSK